MTAQRVLWATTVSANPMGQQTYEAQLKKALYALSDPGEFTFDDVTAQGLRGHDPTARRLPARLTHGAPYPLAALVGALVWRTRGLVHRFDTRLPPFPGREVLTVHDVAALRFPDEGTHTRSWARGIKSASAVVAPSRFAASEISVLSGRGDVVVIPNGVADVFLNEPTPLDPASLLGLGITGDYVLQTGGATKRKNLASLAGAWTLVHDRLPHLTLVLAGPDDPRRDALFKGLPRVVILGRVADELLPSLIAAAHLCVCPSVYEGFGLPALEALACGVPVVAANRSATPEVCGSAALLVDPSPEGLARGLEAVCERPELQRRLAIEGRAHASSYTWARSAEAHAAVYTEVLRLPRLRIVP